MSLRKPKANFTPPPPKVDVVPFSGLVVTEEMKKFIAQPGFLSAKRGSPGKRFHYLYLSQSAGFNPNHLSPFGMACYLGLLDLLKEAFANGTAPDLNTTETAYKQGYATYIVLGAQRVQPLGAHKSRWLESLEFLISKGLPLNIPDIGGLSPLQHLLSVESADKKPLLKLLLQKGADVNQQNSWGETPLKVAMTCEDIESMELLLDHGADVTLVDGDGNCLLKTYTAFGTLVAATFDKWLKAQIGKQAPLSNAKQCDNCRVDGKSFKKCARCKTAQYCSKECQTKSWRTHKLVCVPFDATSAITVKPFYQNLPDGSYMPIDPIRRGLVAGLPTPNVSSSHMRGNHVPENLPSTGKHLVIKVQVPEVPPKNGPLLVYTKKRDLHCLILRKDGAEAYDQLVRAVTERGVSARKGYFVAHLKSPEELSIKTSEILGAQPW